MKISACVITKNEEKNMERYLKYMKPIADEIIVVDTGSTDKTVEMAKAGGAKVCSFKWINDFSAAKNYAIEQAAGDWIIFLDADESFYPECVKEVRKTLVKMNNQKNCEVIAVLIVNIDEDNNYNETSSWTNVKIFRNKPYLRYRYEVHEELHDTRPGKEIGIYVMPDILQVYHNGYSTGIIADKLRRNLAIIRDDIEENGEQPRHYKYLADCYHGLHEYETAVKYARKQIASNYNIVGGGGDVYATMIDAMIESKKFGEAEIKAAVQEAMQKYPSDGMFPTYLASYYFVKKQYVKSLPWFQKAEAIIENEHKRKKEDSDLRMQDISVNRIEGKYTYVKSYMGEIYEFSNEKSLALNYYMDALLLYKYNDSALKGFCRLTADMEAADIIQILKSIYADNKRDISFIVKQLLKLPFNKVYVYYVTILENKYGEIHSPYSVQYKLLAAAKYKELYQISLDGIDNGQRFLAANLMVSYLTEKREIGEMDTLPSCYQVIAERLSNEKVKLADSDFTAYYELGQEILTLNEAAFNEYLMVIEDFSTNSILKMMDLLKNYGLYSQMIIIGEYLLSRQDKYSNQVLQRIAYAAYKSGQYKQAKHYYEQIIASGNEDAETKQYYKWCCERG